MYAEFPGRQVCSGRFLHGICLCTAGPSVLVSKQLIVRGSLTKASSRSGFEFFKISAFSSENIVQNQLTASPYNPSTSTTITCSTFSRIDYHCITLFIFRSLPLLPFRNYLSHITNFHLNSPYTPPYALVVTTSYKSQLGTSHS